MSDAAIMMQYDANKKSTGVAYLLWFFLGMAGAHRFYLGYTGSALTILGITFISIVLMAAFIGFLTIGISGLWVLCDLFLIPGLARKRNTELATRLGMGFPAAP